MFYRLVKSAIFVPLTTVVVVICIGSRADAQTSPSFESEPIRAGVYSHGIQRLEVVHSSENTCLRGLPDPEVQARITDALREIRQVRLRSELEFSATMQQELETRRAQIETLFEDDSLIEELHVNGDITAAQAQQLRTFRDNPQSLDAFLEQQSEEAHQRLVEMIDIRAIEAEEEIRERAGRLAFQGVASLSLTHQDISTYTLSGTDLILLPQEGGRLVFGSPSYLQELHFIEEAPASNSLILQQCLGSDRPYSQIAEP